MTQRVIALLGRKDQPTDAVEEYCRYLGAALGAHDIELEIRRVPWELRGWAEALRGLRLMSVDWRGRWVLVQYTALAWSERGFSHRFIRVLKILKNVGARVAVVFHDVEPYSGPRAIDRLRRAVQLRTMRRARGAAELRIFPVPMEKLSWNPGSDAGTAFVPVGANLPISPRPGRSAAANAVPTVAVFSITGGEQGAHEARWIVEAMSHASRQLGAMRLDVFGRHAELRERDLEDGLRGQPVEVCVQGVIEPHEVAARLCASDVLLFVRGSISSQRGSAIAGIACGLPVIAFSGPQTTAPITDAGVALIPAHAPQELGAALVRVFRDVAYREELAARSRAAYQAHFCWAAIAARVAERLQRTGR